MPLPDDSLPRLECRFFDKAGADSWADVAPVCLKETVAGEPPRQATWFKTAWDSEAWRVLFHARDTDAWATLTEHDAALYNEEVVEVFIDTAGDLESYFEIEVNPLNAVCDLVLRRNRSGYSKDFAWHCEGLKTAVHKGEGFWEVEMIIPFASLGAAAPVTGQRWRVNFFRIDRPRDGAWELSAWSPTGIPLFHVQKKFGVMEFTS